MARKEHPQSRGMKRKDNEPRAANKVRVHRNTSGGGGRNNNIIPVDLEYEDDDESKADTPRRLTWKNTKKGTSGVFIALYDELFEGVPEEISAPPEDRIAMYEHIKSLLEARASADSDIIDTGTVTVAIPWTMLDFPQGGVGREIRIKRGHVGHIVQHYRKSSWAVPVVAMRPVYDDENNLVTVLFEVTDGYHRRTIALERAYSSCPEELRTGKNPRKLEVSVSEVESIKDSALSFTDNNAGSVPVTRDDSWRNMSRAELPEVVATNRLAAEYGLDASAPMGTRGWPRCHGKIIMHMCNITFGGGPYAFPWMKEKDVRVALRFITDPDCVGVYRNTEAINKQNFFAGLCHFIAYYYRPGYVHDIGLRHLLANPDIVERTIELGANITPDIIQIEMPHVTAAMLSRDETMRYHRCALALKRLYVNKVPPPKNRSRIGGWPACPAELRQLFHTAPDIKDDKKRAEFIAKLQKKLDALDKKQRAKSSRNITR